MNAAHPKFAYVGCFTTEKRKARGKGIAVFRIDHATGAWTAVEAYDAIPNPHYLALDHTQKFLYSAHGDSSEIGAYARDAQCGNREGAPVGRCAPATHGHGTRAGRKLCRGVQLENPHRDRSMGESRQAGRHPASPMSADRCRVPPPTADKSTMRAAGTSHKRSGAHSPLR